MSAEFAPLPLTRAHPDATRFIDVVMGRRASERPPMVEYLIDDALLRRTIEAGHPRGRFAIGSGNSIPSHVPARD